MRVKPLVFIFFVRDGSPKIPESPSVPSFPYYCYDTVVFISLCLLPYSISYRLQLRVPLEFLLLRTRLKTFYSPSVSPSKSTPCCVSLIFLSHVDTYCVP